MAKNALCIGINDYPGTGSDLAGCVNDANDWKATLQNRGFTVTQLLDSKATKDAMVREMRNIGMDHDGKTPGQVALNWLLCKGALPIPGVKNHVQAQQNLGTLGWRLTAEAVARLDDFSRKFSPAR